jgi:hypothetical protein
MAATVEGSQASRTMPRGMIGRSAGAPEWMSARTRFDVEAHLDEVGERVDALLARGEAVLARREARMATQPRDLLEDVAPEVVTLKAAVQNAAGERSAPHSVQEPLATQLVDPALSGLAPRCSRSRVAPG